MYLILVPEENAAEPIRWHVPQQMTVAVQVIYVMQPLESAVDLSVITAQQLQTAVSVNVCFQALEKHVSAVHTTRPAP